MAKYSVSEGKTFEALPADKYQVEIYEAKPFTGTEYGTSNPQDQVKFTFVILNDDKMAPEGNVEVPARGRRLWLQTTTKFSPVGSKKSTNLTQLVVAVYGHELESAEVEVFDETDLLGKQLCVLVGQKSREDGSIGNKILSFSKAVKQLEKYDDSEFATSRKEAVGKSAPAVVDSGEDFEAEMTKSVAKQPKT